MSTVKNHPNILDINKIREDFPILSRTVYEKPLVYLDNAATSQKPNSVITSLTEYYTNYNSNVHRGVHALSMQATEQFEMAREKLSHFINAKSPVEIVWTRGTTEAINLVAAAWGRKNIKSGDEIVVTQMEHHSNLVPWQQLAKAVKAKLRFLPISSDGTLNLENATSIINSKTKLLSIVHTSNSLGTINPVKKLVSIAKTVGAAVLIDGAQSTPHMPIDVQDIDCDFFALSGHKMLGPTGIGAIYVKKNILENMDPYMTGGEMVLEVSLDEARWNDLPMKFEAGTPNIADAIALGKAVEYLENIGMDNVRQHEMEITEYAISRLDEIKGLKIFGPRDIRIRGGVISFYSENLHPHDLGTFLDRNGIALRTGHHCTMPVMRILGVPATARISFYIYNTFDEVNIFVKTVKEALRYFTHEPQRH